MDCAGENPSILEVGVDLVEGQRAGDLHLAGERHIVERAGLKALDLKRYGVGKHHRVMKRAACGSR